LSSPGIRNEVIMVPPDVEKRNTNTSRAKISLGILVPLLIGIFLIIAGSLAFNKYKTEKEMKALEEESADLSQALKGQQAMANISTKSLQEAQARLEKASNYFPPELVGSKSLQAILTEASQNNVQVTLLQEKQPARKIVGESVYYAWPFNIATKGSLWSLLAFINKLEQSEIGPVVFQRVTLDKNESDYSASLEIAFYTRSRTEVVPVPQKQEKAKK